MTMKTPFLVIVLLLMSISVCFANRGDLTWFNDNPTLFTIADAANAVNQAPGKGVSDYVNGIIGNPGHNVQAYQIKYWSVNYADQPTLVSGIILVPQVTVPKPVLIYQHGTLLLNEQMPSIINEAGKLSVDVIGQAATMAARGYIVVMTDYVGAGLCATVPNEYLFAQGEANNGVDAYIAAQSFFAKNTVVTNGKLFVAGYSQGGQAAAALAQLLQEHYPQYPVTAAAFMEGPYDAPMELPAELYWTGWR